MTSCPLMTQSGHDPDKGAASQSAINGGQDRLENGGPWKDHASRSLARNLVIAGTHRSTALYLGRTFSARLLGVCDAVYREFLFGIGPYAWGEFQSSDSSPVTRVCSRRCRKRSSNFVPYRLFNDTTRCIVDFTASDSAKHW